MRASIEESLATRDPSVASAESVNSLDPGWLKCNLDTGASLTVFPRKVFEETEPDGMRLKTASGEVVSGYGPGIIHGRDTTGMMRKLNGTIADVRKILVSAAAMHERGYSSWLGPGGGDIIPLNHPISQELGEAYKKAVRKHGKEGIIPVHEENGVYNFYIEQQYIEHGVVAPLTPDEPPPQRPRTPPRPGYSESVASVPPRSRTRTPRPHPVCALEEDGGERGEEMERVEDAVVVQDVEARPARPGWSLPEPTERERLEHETSGHAVFRSWCDECVKATGYAQQHRRVDHSQETMNTVVMDYFYMSDDDKARPHLVAQDRKTGMVSATSLDKNGMVDPTGQKLLTHFLELLGYKEVCLKSDGEHSLVRMKKAAGKEAKCLVKVVPEESPAGDAKANGEAESAVKEIKWRIRAMQLMVERKLGAALPENHPLY